MRLRTALCKYMHLEPEDEGWRPLFEYCGDRASMAIGLSLRHFAVGIELDEWEYGEPLVRFYFGPVYMGLHLYPSVRSEGWV